MIIILIIFVILLIDAIISDRKKKKALEREKEEFIKKGVAEYMKQWDAKYHELQLQLDAVRYQLDQLDILDSYIDHSSTDEKEVKKAFAIEQKYERLWKKERDILRKMDNM